MIPESRRAAARFRSVRCLTPPTFLPKWGRPLTSALTSENSPPGNVNVFIPKHQVIRDVGHSLLGVLRAELSAQKSKAKALLAAPTAELLRKNAPCLVLHLYDVRPHIDVRVTENWNLEEEVTSEKGETYVVRYGRPLELGLRYLLTASADDASDEHE